MGNESAIGSDVYYNTYLNQQSIITILLDKDICYHGDNLTGKIQLTLRNYFSLSDIILSLKVNEGWVNNINKENCQSDTNEIFIGSMRLNIKRQLNIMTPLVNLPSGMHIFTFSFPIPIIQPSFELSTKQCKGFIRYVFGVSTESVPAQVNQKHVVIHSRTMPLMHPLVLTNETKLSYLIFFDKGSCSLQASIQKNNITFQETVPINITIDNTKGDLDTKYIKVSFIRHFKFHKKNSNQEEGIRKKIKSECFNINCKKNSQVSQTINFVLQEENISEFTHNQVFNPYPNSISKDQFLASVDTAIFTCHYQLKVSLYFTSFVSNSCRPRVIFNVALVHDPFSISQHNSVVEYQATSYNNNNRNVYQHTQSMILQQPNYPNQMMISQSQMQQNYQPPKHCAQSQLNMPVYMQQQPNSNSNNNINQIKNPDCLMPSSSNISQSMNNYNNYNNQVKYKINGNNNNDINLNFVSNDYPELDEVNNQN